MPRRLTSEEKLILRSLLNDPLTYWELISIARMVFPLFSSTINKLISQKLINYKKYKFSLTIEGKLIAAQQNLLPIISNQINYIEALDQANKTKYRLIQKDLIKICSGRPKRLEKLDQAFAPAQVALSRAIFMHLNADLENSSILLVGDDDCLGAALALTKLPNKVTVLEYDLRLISYYKSLELPNLEIIHYDARQVLPKQLVKRFDVFFTDPTPTIEVTTLFLSRCFQGLKQKGIGYFTISELEASWKKWQKFQLITATSGFAITDIVRGFNTYELSSPWLMKSNWKVITKSPVKPLNVPRLNWYKSSLVRIQSTGKIDIPYKKNMHFKKNIYMDKELLG